MPTGNRARLSVFYRNYKTIDGLQIPLMIESGADIAKASDKMVIDKVVLNPPLEDKVFTKPNVPIPGRGTVVSAGEPRQEAGAARHMQPRSTAGLREAQ